MSRGFATSATSLTAVNLNLNPFSPVFWSTVAGAASAVCGALGLGTNLSGSVRDLLIAVGGVLMAIPAHHTVKASVAKKASQSPD
jgi:hypothetical protein